MGQVWRNSEMGTTSGHRGDQVWGTEMNKLGNGAEVGALARHHRLIGRKEQGMGVVGGAWC